MEREREERERRQGEEKMQRETIFKPSYAESAALLPHTQTRDFAGNREMKFQEESMKVVLLPTTTQTYKQPLSDNAELSLNEFCKVSVEETTPKVEPLLPVNKATKTHWPIEETAPPSESSTVVTSLNHSPPLANTAIAEKHLSHEIVSVKDERIQSDIEDLKEKFERLQSDVKKEKSDREREVSELEKGSQELKSIVLELKSVVLELKTKLENREQQLKEAQDEIQRLRNDNAELADQLTDERARSSEERKKFKEEIENLQGKLALAEKEKSDHNMRLQNEASLLQDIKQNYERELRKQEAETLRHKKEIEKHQSMSFTDCDVDAPHESQGSKWIWIKDLGSGGFGKVFLAKTKWSPEQFAVKQMTLKDSDHIDKQEEMVQAFIKEMKVLQDCKHKHVVKYIDKGIAKFNSDLHFYIIMEYMSQGSLLSKKTKLLEPETKYFTNQLLQGLQYLHSKDIIHCDIKCSNILLNESGDIKLADFGCAKFKKSKKNRMFGTVWWMAPELVSGRTQCDEASEKSDIWSVGATVVEMLTGKRPFADHEQQALIYALGKKTIRLEEFISKQQFSANVEKFLGCCLKWDPSERADVEKLMNTPFVCS